VGAGFISGDVAGLDERFDVLVDRFEDTVKESFGIHDGDSV